MRRFPGSWRRALLVIAAACVGAVALAVFAQQALDMRPCPWCILQRVIFLAIALLCIAGALLGSARLRRGLAGLVLVLAGGGIASAMWQNAVAAKSFSCNLTFADKVVGALGLEAALPALFQVTASCAEAAATLLGVPFEFWSLALFALIAATAAWLVAKPPLR